MFLRDFFFDLLPFDPERRIGQHVVELLPHQAVIRQRVAVNDVADVLPLDQQVRFANRVGLAVQLLPVHHQPRIRVERFEILFRH